MARDMSGEEEVRAAPRRSGDSFAAVFEANPIPTLVSRVADGLILMANAACLSVFGWPAEEFVGKTVAEVSLWADPEQRPVIVDRLRADGRVRDLEVAVRCRNGEIKRTLGSLELLELDGQPCLIAVFQDLTEQTRLEAALRESEQRLMAFFDHAPAIVSIKDRDGRYLLINRRITEDLGLRPSEVIGGSTRELFPDAADEAEKAEERVLAEGAVVTREQSLAGADGVMHDYQVLKFPLRSADGAVYAVGTIATEVTERQLGARRAAELFDSFPAPVTIYEPVLGADREIVDFIRVYANPRNAEIVGRPLEDVIGASLRETSIPALFDIVFPVYVRVSQTGTPELLPTVEMTDPATGGPLILAVQVSRVGDRVAQVSRDVTVERTAEREIRAARAEAEAANRAKSEFLSRMSHELRTPLNAILGFSQLLELDELTSDQLDSVGHISKAGRHLLGLIDEVLDLSRIESGHLPVSLEPVRLDELAREAMDMVAPIAAARRINLADALPRTGVFVLADRQRLKQVILNLLSNAVKYNREGGEVRLFCETIGNERLRLIVMDTGIGIAEANLDRVFAPFERLGAEQSEVEGSGLGLALTKRLVEAMRGTIRAESEVGRGSTFSIDLEVTEAPAEPPVEPEPPAAAARPAGMFAATILYIEDNVSNVQLVERIAARRPGVIVLSAMQGSLGLEMALRHGPDLILLDLNLPDMPGEEVLRRLRAEPATARTPVVVISADATAGQADRLRSSGATDYLTKPFEVASLLGWIDRVAGGGELSGPTTSRGKVARRRSATQTHAVQGDALDPEMVRPHLGGRPKR